MLNILFCLSIRNNERLAVQEVRILQDPSLNPLIRISKEDYLRCFEKPVIKCEPDFDPGIEELAQQLGIRIRKQRLKPRIVEDFIRQPELDSTDDSEVDDYDPNDPSYSPPPPSDSEHDLIDAESTKRCLSLVNAESKEGDLSQSQLQVKDDEETVDSASAEDGSKFQSEKDLLKHSIYTTLLQLETSAGPLTLAVNTFPSASVVPNPVTVTGQTQNQADQPRPARKVYYQKVFKRKLRSGFTTPCEKCNLIFSSRKAYQAHCKAVHPNEQLATTFKESDLNEQQQATKQQLNPSSGPVTNTTTKNSNLLVGRPRLSFPPACKICTKPFRSRDAYQRHKKIHPTAIAIEEDKTLTPLKAIAEAAVFPNTQKKKRKRKPYTGKLTPCQLCNITFQSKSAFQRHKKLVHPNEKIPTDKIYSCQMCTMNFTKQRSLKDHQDNIHLKIKRYLCPECGAAFYRKTTLIDHAKIHSNFYGYQCQYCDKKFKQKQGWFIHTRKHLQTEKRVGRGLIAQHGNVGMF